MLRTTWLALFLILPLTQAGAETLEFVNGDKLSGKIVERTVDHVVLEHAVLGRVTVPTAKLEPVEPVNPGLFGTGFLRGWKRSIEMGLSGASGNSETKDLRAGVNLGYEDETRRWKFEARYLFSEQDRDTSQNNFRTSLNRDFLLPNSRWFFFAGGRYDWDDFQNWEHRLTLAGGPGYEFFTSESFNLRGRIGPSLTIQRGDDDDVKGELLLGLEAVWRISDGQALNLSNSIFPALSDPGEFRNVTNADWTVHLSERYPLALKLGIENDYESDVDPDTEKNDLKYYGSLLYSF